MKLPYKPDAWNCPASNFAGNQRQCSANGNKPCTERNYGGCKIYLERVKPLRDQIRKEKEFMRLGGWLNQ